MTKVCSPVKFRRTKPLRHWNASPIFEHSLDQHKSKSSIKIQINTPSESQCATTKFSIRFSAESTALDQPHIFVGSTRPSTSFRRPPEQFSTVIFRPSFSPNERTIFQVDCFRRSVRWRWSRGSTVQRRIWLVSPSIQQWMSWRVQSKCIWPPRRMTCRSSPRRQRLIFWMERRWH